MKRSIRFTHPFHPLLGREFEVVDVRRAWGEEWFYFYDDEENLVAVRGSWTDASEAEPFVAISAGRSRFRVVDLLRLAELVSQLSEAGD